MPKETGAREEDAALAEANPTPTRDSIFPRSPHDSLQSLLSPSAGGRPVASVRTPASQKRQVTRTDQSGLAVKVAGLFESIITSVNETYNLDLYPLRVRDVLSHMKEGKPLLEQTKENKKHLVLSQSHQNLVRDAGRACTAAVLGNIAKENVQGKLKPRQLAEITGKSESWIRRCRSEVEKNGLGAFGAMNKSGLNKVQVLCPTRLNPAFGECETKDCKLLHDCQCCRDGSDHSAAACPKWDGTKALRADKARVQRNASLTRTIDEAEAFSTTTWMRKENPARSGDQKNICWMVKGRFDFYHENYTTVEAQVDIIKIALDRFGDELRAKARSQSNVWLRNVSVYVDALENGCVHELKIARGKSQEEVQLNFDDLLAEVLEISSRERNEVASMDGEELDDIIEDDDPALMVHTSEDHLTLRPRSYKYFYGQVLKGERLWKRPPHDHCERCAKYTIASDRLTNLQVALLSVPGSVDHCEHSDRVAKAGGPVKAWEEVRLLQLKLPDLLKHVTWEKTARAYLKKLELSMPATTVLWQLDYGGLNDSVNNKVAVWSVTVISSQILGREQEHFDFFFAQARSRDDTRTNTAKKDGNTGMYMLGELLDPSKSPNKDNISLFAAHYPHVTDLIFSGDTGNGYRAYQMLEELSNLMGKYGYRVKLIPLAPGHAWNRTDARIAHMNTFLNVILSKSRVIGARDVAAVFRAASDPRLKNQRKYMARSHIFFRVVHVDSKKAEQQKKTSEHYSVLLFCPVAKWVFVVSCILLSPSKAPTVTLNISLDSPKSVNMLIRICQTTARMCTLGERTLLQKSVNIAAMSGVGL